MSRTKRGTKAIAAAAWYTIILTSLILLYCIGGTLWNKFLGERTNILIRSNPSSALMMVVALSLFSAVAMLKLKKAGYVGVFVFHVLLVAGSALAFIRITQTNLWGVVYTLASVTEIGRAHV